MDHTRTNSMKMPTSHLVQHGGNLAIPSGPFNQLKDATMADNTENVDDLNQFGFFKEFFGDEHKALAAAAYATSDQNNPSTLSVLGVEGEMVLSPKHASNISYHEDGLFDVESLRTAGRINKGGHIGCLGNNQSSESMVFRPLLGGSLKFFGANSQSSQQFLQIDSQVSNTLPGVNSGMAVSTILPYMQFSKPFEAEAKNPFSGQNRSCCSVEAKTADHLSLVDSSNLIEWAIQHRILLAYTQYKKSMVIKGDARVSFVDNMHSVACSNHSCKCEQFFFLVSHYDCCHDADCKICGPVWYSFVTNRPHPKFEQVKRGRQRDSNYGYSDHPSCGRSETMQPSLKRLKVENSSWPSLANGICCATNPLKVQPCYSKLPPLQQFPDPVPSLNPSCDRSETMQPFSKHLKGEGPCPSLANGICSATTPLKVQPCYSKLPPLQQLPDPVSINSEVMEVNMEVLTNLIKDSTSAEEIGNNVADNFPISVPSDVVVCSYNREGDVDLTNSTDIADNVSYGRSEAMQPSLNRLKVENPSFPCLANGICSSTTPLKVQPCYSKLPPLQQLPHPVSINSEVMEVNVEVLPKLIEDSTSAEEIGYNVADNFPISVPSEVVVCSYNREGDMDFTNCTDIADNVIDHCSNLEFNSLPSFSGGFAAGCEGRETEARTNSNQAELAIENGLIAHELNCKKGLAAVCEEGETEVRTSSNQAELVIDNEFIAQESNCEIEIKPESQRVRDASLTENFTARQIMEHISSLQCIDQNLTKKEKGKRIANVDSENSCQLCGADKLSLAAAPIYCSSCGSRIRRGASYYSTPEENDIRHCLCTSCSKASRAKSIRSSAIALSMLKLNQKKNDEEVEESWVQCDKCEGWQHQICALFNDKNDVEGKAQYICPKCCLKEIQNGERIPPLMSTVSGAKDLPRTMLSDHIEQRIFRRLQREREEKARVTGKSIDEVPEAEGLVVRVVLSVDKLVKVNKQLLDILQNENYPAEFPYKSKAILLFQKIEGVDVCLFGMYVQEFGSECGHPNQRCVYISYLDSVKYFRPETETTSGEALRTVVYHEILMGYLEYCKKRGFATCYLWVCPPLKGEDYILYCHPEVQKTPKPDKLRQWYQSMLRKAAKEKIVVDSTNLYDHFFVSTGQYNSKVTASHLPYFDGDYWTGAAEDIIKNIEKASSEESQKTGKKIMSKRMLKAMGYTNPSGDATKDILLMQKLGHTILPIKEDFIIAHLQFVCTRCHRAILSGWRWFCSLCKGFQLCERCYDAEANVYKEDCTHTFWNGEKHLLSKIMVDDVPSDTDDEDVSMDNGLFGSRHSFLSFCQKNNYQLDTLRRAKHSSMMILHYLHNPTGLLTTTRTTSCSICYKDTSVNQWWLCEMCPNVAVCAACYQRDGCSFHIHKLALHNSATKNRNKKKDLLKKRVLDVLLHACECCSSCSYPDCPLIKKLFAHAKNCSIRASGGCKPCKKMWLMLRLHAQSCNQSDCRVPRCRDLKLHGKFSAQKSEALGKG